MAKLVAIGDSLTQGFQSLAIHKTNLSYPAMIAQCLGEEIPDFRVPNFMGKGGLPLNIEWLARQLERRYGQDINFFEWPFAVDSIVDLMDEVEDHWERGKGARKSSNLLYHNLAVWGFEVADAYNINAKMCKEKIEDTKDEWFQLPSEPRLRTAYRVLNPPQTEDRDDDTQIEIARRIKKSDGEIENLLVWLGANNCLGTVTSLKVKETGQLSPGPNSKYTLWTPAAFKSEFHNLADQIDSIGAKNVYVATVPHVTIPPITRGIMKNRGRLPNKRRYFDFYTHFFIKDKSFNPDRDPHLTREDAQKIDSYIDEYNSVIRTQADDKGWEVVDTCMLLDQLAVRRNHGSPKYKLPDEIKDLGVRFFEIDKSGNIANGGLISLDGIHPTTCGYGVIAQEFINVMKAKNPGIRGINFEEIRYWDSLVTKPPRTLDDVFGMLKTLEKWFHISRILK